MSAASDTVDNVAFAGGFADKVGNEYETWWTLRRVTQLLRGDIDAMAVEPLGADGAELWVESKGLRTYDQVKFRSSGRWTPSKLRSDGVLAKLHRQYAAGSRILLVLSQPSEEFERLISLAVATSSGAELWDVVTDSTDLELVRDAWNVGKEETREYLLRTAVRHDGLPHLKEYVELALETLLVGDVNSALAAIRRFLEDNVTTIFTAPMLWSALETAGVAARPRVDPGPTISRLRDGFERHMRSVRRAAPNGGIIRRNEVSEIVSSITTSRDPVLLVVGKAGAGKSVIVAEAAAELAQLGRHVAALRLDRVEPNTSTADQLGTSMDLDRSPIVSLSEVSPEDFDGVLVIDQLDAVSNYSGRMPTVFDAVEDSLNQARLLGNVRVILAVRSIDLEEDPRLRRLAGEKVPIIEVGELATEDVKTYLGQLGTDISLVDDTTLQLLRLPIHLFVFNELRPEMRSASYRTLTSLYGAFTRSFRTRLEREGHPDEWPEVSRIIVARMNEDEALSVPAKVLEYIRPLYIEALISANVLVEEDGRLALFHETYFDYLFANSFSARGNDLIDWFASSGQGLFRRSQLRQLLTYIAAEERSRFVDQIPMIARSPLRPHLVSIAYTVLASITPTAEEWIALRELVSTENRFGARLVSLVGGAEWFTAVDSTGDVERLLDDPEWGDIFAGAIAQLAADLPDRVLALLEPRQQQGEAWIRALRAAIEVSDSPVWAQFALDQLAIGGLDLPGQPFDLFETLIFHRMTQAHSVDAVRLLVDALTLDVDRAIEGRAASLHDPLSRRGRHFVDHTDIEQLASTAGPIFVEAMLPLIEKVATYAPPSGQTMWRYRYKGSHRDLGDDLFFSFDKALAEFTRNRPDEAFDIIKRLSSHNVEALDFLACRSLLAAPSNQAADWFLAAENHRDIGWLSDLRWESRCLIEHASGTCSDDRFAALELAILYWVPEYEKHPSNLQWRGSAELEFLSALAVQRLSVNARRRLAELYRKFPHWKAVEPVGSSGGTVQSPIGRESAEQMLDADWLRAAEKYDGGDRLTFRAGGAFGGSAELASMMGAIAKESPSRFVELALQFPPSMPAAYTENVIRSVAGEIDQLELYPLLRKFRIDHPQDSGRAVASAIDNYRSGLTEELFQELLSLTTDTDPSREIAREKTNSDYYFGGDFVTAGINSTRGMAANTLARVILADSSRLDPALATLQNLARDPIIAVRCLAAEAALAYASIARADGLNLLARILDDDLVLTSSTALEALRWAMLWDADRFAPFLTRALEGEGAKIAGAHWANCAVNGALGSTTSDVTTLSEQARLGAAESVASVPRLATELLGTLFDDPSSSVRRQAAHCVHYLKDVDVATREVLFTRLLESVAFDEVAGDVLNALEEVPGQLPDVSWEICRRVIAFHKLSPSGQRGARTADLIAILVRLFRSSDLNGRKAALDLIDETVLLQLWRVDQVLDEAR